MTAFEAKAIMVEAIKEQDNRIREEVLKNTEKYILPQIERQARKGKNCTVIRVPSRKRLYGDRLVELGYKVNYEKKNELFVRWA